MQSVVSDLLLTNTIISLLLWDNEVASVLFPLPSGVLRKVVSTAADVTVDRTPGTRVLKSSKVTECVIDHEGFLEGKASETGCDSGERSALNYGSV